MTNICCASLRELLEFKVARLRKWTSYLMGQFRYERESDRERGRKREGKGETVRERERVSLSKY